MDSRSHPRGWDRDGVLFPFAGCGNQSQEERKRMNR